MAINLTQKLVFETDSLDSFENVLDTFVRTLYAEKPTEYAQLFLSTNQQGFNDGKMWLADKQIYTKPNYLHICSIGDYKGSILDRDDVFDNYAQLIKTAMVHLKKADFKKFVDQCGTGYDATFNPFDGTVDGGYRLNHRALGGWANLDISLCHIYYGK